MMAMQPVRVKICGLTTVADALAAVDCGADAIGLNFHPPSPRCIEPAQAAEILRFLPPFTSAIAVVVNRRWETMVEWARRFPRLNAVQIHGDLPEPGPELPFIPAFGIKGESDVLAMNRFLAVCRARGPIPTAVLVDAKVDAMFGGTGQTAPWNLLENLQLDVPLILAGGLTPENVAEAIRRVRPYAVDVASGVESSPGRKDPEKISRFIEAVHDAL